jgi:hypothetical protein
MIYQIIYAFGSENHLTPLSECWEKRRLVSCMPVKRENCRVLKPDNLKWYSFIMATTGKCIKVETDNLKN